MRCSCFTKENAMHIQCGIMAEPDHFEVLHEFKTNLSMDKSRQPDKVRAKKQWENVKNVLQDCGVEIITFPSAGPGISDFTFVANAGLAIPGTDIFIVSNFYHKERAPEIPHIKRLLKNRFEILELASDEKFEGAGDAFFWERDVLFIAHGVRTNEKGAGAVKRLVQKITPRIKVELLPMKFWVEDGKRKKVSFYHRDMCLLPMRNKRTFLVYTLCFEQEAIHALNKYGELVTATKNQAYNFVCNGIEVDGDTVLLPWTDDYTLRQFSQDFGYRTIHVCPTTEFWLSGGGPQCLFLEIPQV